MLVTTLLRSLPMLFDVFLLCMFALFIFGIIGVFVFKGALRYRCMDAHPYFDSDGLPVANYT